MSEGEPVARSPSFQCPDCRVAMEPIKLLDATEPGWQREGTAHVELHYAAPDARRSFFNAHIPPLGQVYGRICPVCGRIQLYGLVAPAGQHEREVFVPEINPRPRRVEPLNLVTRPPENDTPPIDPPQPIPSSARWDRVAPSWRSEPVETPREPPQPAFVLEWYVETVGEADSREGFANEQAAEAAARDRVRKDESARVFVLGPRGRRYRVLP